MDQVYNTDKAKLNADYVFEVAERLINAKKDAKVVPAAVTMADIHNAMFNDLRDALNLLYKAQCICVFKDVNKVSHITIPE